MAIAIFNRKAAMKLEPLAEGTLTADGSEQTVVESTTGVGILSGFISLKNLDTADTIIIRAYAWINGHYGLYGQDSYTGIQPEPALRFTGIRFKDKFKVTLEQSQGTYRDFDYEFVKES